LLGQEFMAPSMGEVSFGSTVESRSAGSAPLAQRSTVAILSIILYVVLLPNIAIL
jgi:hypothetical protein